MKREILVYRGGLTYLLASLCYCGVAYTLYTGGCRGRGRLQRKMLVYRGGVMFLLDSLQYCGVAFTLYTGGCRGEVFT